MKHFKLTVAAGALLLLAVSYQNCSQSTFIAQAYDHPSLEQPGTENSNDEQSSNENQNDGSSSTDDDDQTDEIIDKMGACKEKVTVSILDSEINCSQNRFYCVDNTKIGIAGYFPTIQAAVDAVGPSAAGKVVIVYGSNILSAPREYDGFEIVGNGAGSKGQASHGGSGDSATQRFIVKAVGHVLLKERSTNRQGLTPRAYMAAIHIQDTDYVTIDGFVIDRTHVGANTSSYNQTGLKISDTDWAGSRPSHGIHIVNVKIKGGSMANLYSANVADVVIEKSEFTDSIGSNIYTNGGMLVYLSNGPSDNVIVRCNYFANSVQMAIHSNGDDNLIENHLYEYNFFKNISGHGIHFQDGRRMTIRNNIFTGMGKSAITAWGINYVPEAFIMYNNLFHSSAGTSDSPIQMGTESYPGSLGFHTIFNNLFIANQMGNDITLRGSTSNNVVAHNYDQNSNVVTQAQVNTTSVPTTVFVDSANNDFRLSSTAMQNSLSQLGVRSVLGAQSVQISVPGYDFASKPRPALGNITIGPYQY